MADNLELKTQDTDSALDEFKALLMGSEQQELVQLRERINDPGRRTADIAEVLAEAVKLSGVQGSELTNALENPVNESIRKAAKKNPELFAESFYPIISPAIRKSISAALKELVQTINQTLDHSLTLKGLRWRFESIRTGIPFSEIILRHTLAYRVEQVLLIRPESGLLIQHITAPFTGENDPDAVSAMLTAISDFVRDAFLPGENGQHLDTVDMGEYTLLLFHGPQAYLACVVRGIEPASLREHCQSVLEKIHQEHGQLIRDFDGNKEDTQALVPLMESCLASEEKGEIKKQRFSTPFIALLLFIIGFVGWTSYQQYSAWQSEQALQSRFSALVESLETAPGIFITSVERQQSKLLIKGMRDTLAVSPEQLIAANSLTDDQVTMTLLPYQDMSPEFIRKRLNAWMMPPATIQAVIDDAGTLRITGSADIKWLERTRALAAVVPGINQIDTSNFIEQDQLLLNAVKEKLNEVPEVALSVTDAVLFAEGVAPLSSIRALEELPASIPGLKRVEHAVTPWEQQALKSAEQRLARQKIIFSKDTTMAAGQSSIESLVQEIMQIRQLSNALSLTPLIHIIGHTDSIGLPAYNRMLANARARTVHDQLIKHGLPSALFYIRESTPPTNNAGENPTMRRVEFQLHTKPTQDSSRQENQHAG